MSQPVCQPAPVGKIFKQITAVMQEIDAIGKTRNNVGQGYKFRGIDEVYNEVHPLLAKHGVFTVPRVLYVERELRQYKAGGDCNYVKLRMSYLFCADDGSSIEAIIEGEGMDSGDKATNKAMAVAHKYAFVQVFAIPTEDAKDPENDDHNTVRPTPRTQAQAPRVPSSASTPVAAVSAKSAPAATVKTPTAPGTPSPVKIETKASLGAQAIALGAELGLKEADVVAYALETFNKTKAEQLTLDDMKKYVMTLEFEISRKGAGETRVER